MITEHDNAVKKIQEQVREYYKRKVPFRVYHGSTNATRVVSFKRSEMIDTSKLDKVLKIDTEKRVALVEPNVSMDKLLDATLEHGLMPPVVTEFPGITVGGAIQGGAIEAGSFRWGTFSNTVNEVEMVLGDGTKIKASPKSNSDLFFGAAGSYGSLGLITAAEVKLIPAKKYVTITHIPVSSFQEGLDKTLEYAKTDCDFIECGMFSKDGGSVVIGKLSDTKEGKLLRFSRAYDPWYYLYIEKNARAKKTVTNTVPLRDYIFRFDRGAFWAAQLAFNQSGLPFNWFTRFVLDRFMRTRKLYQAVQESAAAQRYICQDIVLPTKTLVPFMEFIDKEFNMYPTGFCAVKADTRSPLLFNSIAATDYVFNVGVYGLRIEPYEKFVAVNRQIEAETTKLGGRKWFYAHSYYTEKEFWNIYDRRWYDKLRKKYHATTLPDIYNRTRVKDQYHINTKGAALKTMLGKAKLRVED
jgi:delta24-sterol reductase